MKPSRVLVLVFALLSVCFIQAGEVALVVKGEVKSELKLTLADLQALPNSAVTVAEREGASAKYEGVLIHEIMGRAGVPLGEALRKDALELCVMVVAADGYRVAFALAELDPAVTDKKVLLAFRREGKELSAEMGPLRLVVADE